MEKSHGMVIVRLAGGLGNQLFEYAAGRSLAIRNNVPLKLDNISGFQRDSYRRSYSLEPFSIKEDFALPEDCFLGQSGRVRRWMLRRYDRGRPFEKCSYIHEEFPNFDSRLLKLKVTRKIYLEGCWQSELYFKDIEGIIRKEFQFKQPHERINIEMAKKIQDRESICVHVRRLHGTPNMQGVVPLDSKDPISYYVDMTYYKKAICSLLERVKNPHFFVFSDYPEWAKENISFDYAVTFVCHNGNNNAYEDLRLMSLCKYFIIANSTFSWWGAWLSDFADKIIFAPSVGFNNTVDLIPESWVVI
jgi:hypothetical protein